MAKRDDHTTRNFLGGLIVGLFVSAPLAAWFSPRSGAATRQEIRQRGRIVRRRAEETVQQVTQLPSKVTEQVGAQLEQIQKKVGGDSIDEALEEGREIAAQRRGDATLSNANTL